MKSHQFNHQIRKVSTYHPNDDNSWRFSPLAQDIKQHLPQIEHKKTEYSGKFFIKASQQLRNHSHGRILQRNLHRKYTTKYKLCCITPLHLHKSANNSKCKNAATKHSISQPTKENLIPVLHVIKISYHRAAN